MLKNTLRTLVRGVFDKDEINRLVDVTISNRCIRDSFAAKKFLNPFFKRYVSSIEKNKFENVMEIL